MIKLWRCKKKLVQIQVIVFDFDGVMTDNTVILDQNGLESVVVSRADGLGIDILRKLGYQMLILSSESNTVVKARADKLKIEVMQSITHKDTVLKEYARQNNIDLSSILYVGNDLNDISVMEIVGCSVAPSDAHRCVKKNANINLKTSGGKGVIREIAEFMKKYGGNKPI